MKAENGNAPSRESSPRQWAAPALALVVVGVMYLLARGTAHSSTEREALAGRFAFQITSMALPSGPSPRFIRAVHPSLERISGWISSVGAAVALADIDGDGLPNDACYVDTRTNRVIVAPVPWSGARYQAFALDLSGLRLDETMAPMGCLPGNFKEDSRTDLLVYFWGRTPVMFLHNSGDGELSARSFVAQELVPGSERWYTNAATAADIDGDGHVDLIFGNYFPDDSRVLDPRAAGAVQMQHSMSAALNGGGPRLLLWTGASSKDHPWVGFRDVSDAIPAFARTGWTLAVGAAALDDRQLPEIYVANDFGADRLLYNQSAPGRPRFSVVYGRRSLDVPKSKTLGFDSFKGMGVDFADIEQRGALDIFVSNITEPYALEESNFAFMNTRDNSAYERGTAPFIDRSEQLGLARGGWGWDVKFGDFDNSGSLQVIQAAGFVRGNTNRWPELQELAMGNDQLLHASQAWPRIQEGDDVSGRDRNKFFVRAADGEYVDVAPELVLDSNDKQPSRGIATADCFGDGRLDFAVSNQWGDTVFYRNVMVSKNRFLGLHLRLPIGAAQGVQVLPGHPDHEHPSRPAIGAIAILTLPDGRRNMMQVDGGNGHSGKRSPDLQFGLGRLPDGTPLQIEIRWRDVDGRRWRKSLQVESGWHTVLLGTAEGETLG